MPAHYEQTLNNPLFLYRTYNGMLEENVIKTLLTEHLCKDNVLRYSIIMLLRNYTWITILFSIECIILKFIFS